MHQRNMRIHDQSGFAFPLMHHDPADRSLITDPDPDHPKGVQPELIPLSFLLDLFIYC